MEDDGIVRNLHWVVRSLVDNVDYFKPQELSNNVWAFSTFGFGYNEACSTNSHNDYIHVGTDDPVANKAPVFEVLEVAHTADLCEMQLSWKNQMHQQVLSQPMTHFLTKGS